MAWTEQANLRNQRSRSYQDDVNPLQRAWGGTLAALHYESQLDSGIYDAEVNMTPQRTDNPQFDGWRITVNGWHYALGKDLANHGDQDGWVGFGGRRGAHWFKFRLARVGYLHWPTRTWDDIGGAPDYNRAKLSREVGTLAVGPNDDEIQVSSTATWGDIWKTPGGGAVSCQWRASGDGLKELITINQATRQWIASNHPPGTPLNETWFGFVFRLDWSDIPKTVRAGVIQDIDGDFADDGEIIELHDALGRLLAFMPLSDVFVPGDAEDVEERWPLRKRFWKDSDGDHYLLVGVRCDVLAALPAGALVFDPPVNEQVGASGDDGYSGGGKFEPIKDELTAGEFTRIRNMWARFTTVAVPDTATITVAYMSVYCYNTSYDGPGTYTNIYMEAADDPAAPSDQTDHEGRARTSEFTVWDDDDLDPDETWYDTPSIVSAVQEVIDRGGWASGQAMQVFVDNDGSDGYIYRLYSYDNDPTYAPKLHIEYTVTGVVFPPVPGQVHRARRFPHLRM